MQRIHKSGILAKISDSARGHQELGTIFYHRWSSNPVQEDLRARATAFHLHLYGQLNSMFDCVARDSSMSCDAGLNWDDAIHQLDKIVKGFQSLENDRRGYPVTWNVNQWIEKEYRLFLELVKLEQWITRPIITPFDGSTLCPANVGVDDIFYDCPVGADEQVVQSRASAAKDFFSVESFRKSHSFFSNPLAQNIKTHFTHGATATFIIEMVGYMSKRAGCTDTTVNIVTTTTGFAIAFYTGSFLSSVAYVASKEMAIYSGLSPTNANRAALAVETGVRVAKNLTVPGIIETSVSMAASYGGSLFGSGVSFFTRKALDVAFNCQQAAREFTLQGIKID